MITRNELTRRWRRTLLALAFALGTTFIVLISLVIDEGRGGDGLPIGTAAVIAAGATLFAVVLFFAAKRIKNLVWKLFGED